MHIHDWTGTDTATFQAFHTAWITHLSEALNGGLLPSCYYALPEQHAVCHITDVLRLHVSSEREWAGETIEGGVALADAPPKALRRMIAPPSAQSMRRTLAVRHINGHQLVALAEVLSPANKDRQAHVDEFADKVEAALLHDVHVLVVDLLPPGRHDPHGIHGAIWDRFDDEPYAVPADQPLTMASYTAGLQPVAYVEHLAVGSELTVMPLFLNPDRYVNVPMETTYQAAFQGLPSFLQVRLDERK